MKISGDTKAMVTVKIALIRALNSLDNEISTNKIELEKSYLSERHYFVNKIANLATSHENMTALYNMMDDAIRGASE